MKNTVFSLLILGLSWQAQAQWLSPQNTTHNLGSAHVEKVQAINDGSVTAKLFHTMPIDPPSINPWFLRLAVVNEDNNSWNVYDLGNVSDYQILPSAQKGYLKITLSKHDYDVQSGRTITKKSTLFVNLTQANRSQGKIEVEEK